MPEYDKTLEVRSVAASEWGPWSEVRTFTTAPEPEPPPPEPVKHGKGWGKGGKK